MALLVTEPARARRPLGAYALEQPEPLIGQVTEWVSAGPSLYLRLQNASGLHWVASPSHAAAMAKTSEVSRGAGSTTHWADAETGATFEKAAQLLETDEGSLH